MRRLVHTINIPSPPPGYTPNIGPCIAPGGREFGRGEEFQPGLAETRDRVGF